MKQTRREGILAEIEAVTPWAAMVGTLEPFYPKGAWRGRPPIGLEQMLRMYVAQLCFELSDEGIEDAIYDSQSVRRFVGIDLPPLEPFRKKRMAKERREGDPFVILQVGTICDRKNQQLLSDALVLVRKAYPNNPIQVQLAGSVFEEGYAETLKRKIDAAGLGEEVEFLGWRSDVHELMAGADVLAMPSRDEGVPNTVQEAMAIGLPVLVSKAEGIPEGVMEEETGWVLPVGRPEAWADRIGWCIENRTQLDTLGQHAADYALEHFGTWQWGAENSRVVTELVCRGRERSVESEGWRQ